MFSTLISATLLSAFAIQAVSAEFSIATVQLNQCAPAHITWTEAVAPYDLAVVPVDDACDSVLVDLGNDHNGLSMTWYNVTLPAGTQVYLSLLDSSDQEAWSAAITVGDGDSACLSNASSSSDAPSSTTSNLTPDTPATTLTLTSSYSRSLSASTESATIVGAANAGTLGNASGAMSSVRLPAAATVLVSLAAIAATLAL